MIGDHADRVGAQRFAVTGADYLVIATAGHLIVGTYHARRTRL